MKRSTSIKALLAKCDSDLDDLRDEYDRSLQDMHVREELKVDTKNIFENLRPFFDYVPHDIFESHCAGAKVPLRLYFPTLVSPAGRLQP